MTEVPRCACAFLISLAFWNSECLLSLGCISADIASEYFSHIVKLRVTLHGTIGKSLDEEDDLIFPSSASGDSSMSYSCHFALMFVFPLYRR